MKKREYDMPERVWPKCAVYGCGFQAECAMYGPDAEMVPGGYYCHEHALGCIREYAEKLHESWIIRPLVDSTQNVGNLSDVPTSGDKP